MAVHFANLPTTRVARCPQCSYDLSNLPTKHRCPECGFAYDEWTIVLENWRLPTMASIFHAIGRNAIYLFATAAAIAALFAAITLLGGLLLVFGGYFLVLLAAHGWFRLRGRGMQCWVAGRDGLQRIGLREQGFEPGRSRARAYSWRAYSHVYLSREGDETHRLHLYPSWWRPMGPPIISALLHVVESEAEAIRDEIQGRINAAKAPEGTLNPRR
jgi:hypothetical protein